MNMVSSFDGYVLPIKKNDVRRGELSWDTFSLDYLAETTQKNTFMINAQRVLDFIDENSLDSFLLIEFGFDIVAYIETNKVQRDTVKSW